MIVSLGDDLECQFGLRRVHSEDREIVDDEQVGADVRTQSPVESAVEFSAVEIVQHADGADEGNTLGRLASAEGQSPSQKGLARTGDPDEERIYATLQKGQVVEREIALTQLLADWIEVEVKAIDSADLRKTGITDSARNRAARTTQALLVSEEVEDLECRQVLTGGAVQDGFQDRGDLPGRRSQRSFSIRRSSSGVWVIGSPLVEVGGSPGSMVRREATSWSY